VHVFCAVLAWSRYRFVRFAADEQQATTLAMLAECASRSWAGSLSLDPPMSWVV
jgi:hypothetical protein